MRLGNCKGICYKYKVEKGNNASGRYADGQKRCQSCDLFMRWDGRFCPCCGTRLRSKPRNTKYKESFRKEHELGFLIEQANRGF